MKKRTAVVKRKTGETDISLNLALGAQEAGSIQSGVGFLDHMLTLWSRHGFMKLDLQATGDVQVDFHHTVEDIGICLGQALLAAVGDKHGISRYGTAFVPMDEALAMVSLDFGGRGYLVFEVEIPSPKVGDFDTELVVEFLRAVAFNAGITLHVRMLSGTNSHHIIEAIFKAFGRALKEATALDPAIKGVLSTKGTI
ncbi:MAG TPA: imidazoleglycerol-phosphate dehydratase HisB [Bacillota bacterium]|nr:imidazoleglycerol-phosphate dehydratase HisB [Bacillota bacterium]